MCLNGLYLELQSIEVAFLYSLNGNSFINSVWALLRVLLDVFFFFYISVLKYYSLRLLQNCKSYQLKSRFYDDFLSILRYNQHKTEFNNVVPVIWARYVINLLFKGIFFWYSLYRNLVKRSILTYATLTSYYILLGYMDVLKWDRR